MDLKKKVGKCEITEYVYKKNDDDRHFVLYQLFLLTFPNQILLFQLYIIIIMYYSFFVVYNTSCFDESNVMTLVNANIINNNNTTHNSNLPV